MIDLDLFLKRQKRAQLAGVEGADFLLKHIADEMDERLSLIERNFNKPLQLYGYNRSLADQIISRGQTEIFKFFEPQNLALDAIQTEALELEDSVHDLILSPASLHLTNDTPGIFAQIFKALKEDGLFMASVLGAGTLHELRESLLIAESELYGGASARVIPFADIRDYGGLLQRAGFALPVIDSDTLTVRYDHAMALMRDLRAMGMTNPLIDRNKRPLSRSFFEKVNEIYGEKFSDPDGRIRASFTIIYLKGWKPHKSQQKPLKPGSAKTRLADALKVDEMKLKS
ncbi:MAG: SAM-dependent methyltransferase [Rhizobiaceae bacterium]|nr:SAM-dependent methyltransferase [Rhizobiaceae bacterium]